MADDERVSENKLFDQATERAIHERDVRRRAGVETGIPTSVMRAEIEGLSSIAAWRKHRRMTQVELAAKAGIDRGYLALLERGHRAGSPKTLANLATALGCLVDDLLSEGGHHEKPLPDPVP